jgi:carboxypeptidase Taq
MKAYNLLEQKFARRASIQDALGILHWDTETMMPKGAAHYRSEATATLRGIAHELLTDGEVQDLLAAAEAEKDTLDLWQLGNLREMRRVFIQESAVPRDLVEAKSKAVLKAQIAWREARPKGDFALLVEPLAQVVELQRAVGAAKGRQLGLPVYDALLESFDPGVRESVIDPIFTELRARLPDLIDQARTRQSDLPIQQAPKGPFPRQAQRRLAEDLMRIIGFDFERGRLDISRQPFCGGATDDVRITRRDDESDFLSALTALFHECGHALYEQGRPRQFLRQPVGEARGLTLHESQALLMEMQACSTREFVSHLAPLARAVFGGTGPEWSEDNLYQLMSKIEPSLIRMDADEMTYVLHAVIRYDLEKSMISGDLPAEDLPTEYNAAINRTFGMTVPNDRVGCLQDIHWSAGLWGYFPSYALGAIVAAQLFDAACKAQPDTLAALAKGNFAPLRDWLQTHIHSKGSLLETDELIAAATGHPLRTDPYMEYLRRRYIELN